METEESNWLKTEYEELNRYGRTIYETLFRLAQMSFVLNGTLGYVFSYIYRPDNRRDMWLFGILVAFLGVIYNIGALCNFIWSMSLLRKLLNGIRSIETKTGGGLYSILVTL